VTAPILSGVRRTRPWPEKDSARPHGSALDEHPYTTIGRPVRPGCRFRGAPRVGHLESVSGQWGKTDPTDVRVMTYNIEDGICRNAVKAELSGGSATPWHALARTVAAMRPDVLILQEAADNTGNGTVAASTRLRN